jgi:hypothetical protein
MRIMQLLYLSKFVNSINIKILYFFQCKKKKLYLKVSFAFLIFS